MISLKLGDFEMFWLNGGEFELDGGTMFGVVPKVLWARKYPPAAGDGAGFQNNYIRLLNAPLLVRTPSNLVLVETGLGNKLSPKQKQIFRVVRDWDLPRELERLGFKRQDIDFVILTHCDFDHAGGIVMKNSSGGVELTFPRARHIIQKSEWEDVLHPDIRSENTYFPENFSKLGDSGNMELIAGDYTVCEGVEVQHTGGHTRGHQIVRLQSGSDIAYHLSDLLPTHVHFNPLWIMAYDNFPLEVIALKQKYEALAVRENAWFTFYHDPAMYACKFDDKGQVLRKVAPEKGPKPAAPKKNVPVQNITVRTGRPVTLSCPDCLVAKEVLLDKYIDRKHFLMVNCPCGTTFGVNLNFRKHYRKNVSLGGYYSSIDSDLGWRDKGPGASIPINCRIKNISMGGLGYIALNRVRAQVGDMLKIKFTLEKDPPEIIEKMVVVRTIRDNYIGCEFTEEIGYSDRTLGFYLLK